MRIRTPAVAGMFYPSDKIELKRTIQECFLHKLGAGTTDRPSPSKVVGAICPHAGYMYSGPVASHSFHAISSLMPKLFIIIGPNHWGVGREIATIKDYTWRTPLGDMEVDSEAVNELLELAEIIHVDHTSHMQEHSIEVQLPMIQYMSKDCKMVPISMSSQDRNSAEMVGQAVANIIKKRDATIIGSSDFTHYQPNNIAYRQDMALIEPILRMDIDSFYKILEEKKISACGYGAIAATISACKKLGATSGKLLKYATSGDVTGDMNSVVGYGAIVFT